MRVIGSEPSIVESRRRDSSPESTGERDGMIACYPTYARQLPGTDRWRVKATGMIARPLPEWSRRRSAALAILRRVLEIAPEHDSDPVFRARSGAFLFQRVVGCRVVLDVGGREVDAGVTDRLGHFETSFDLDSSDLEGLSSSLGWIGYQARLDAVDGQEQHLVELLQQASGGPASPEPAGCRNPLSSTGQVQFIPPAGLSVISDIDDTVKLSDVGDRRELLANTFLRPFQPVPGMVDLYRQWHAEETAFHYVSASPWQLAGCLAGFFEESGLPTGSMHMSLFRFKDITPLGRIPSKKRSKRRAIEQILRDFPGRRFVLVGDSGEKDPEIYAAVARRFPQQVAAIAIREVAGRHQKKSLEERLSRLRQKLTGRLVQPFQRAEELDSFLASAAS